MSLITLCWSWNINLYFIHFISANIIGIFRIYCLFISSGCTFYVKRQYAFRTQFPSSVADFKHYRYLFFLKEDQTQDSSYVLLYTESECLNGLNVQCHLNVTGTADIGDLLIFSLPLFLFVIPLILDYWEMRPDQARCLCFLRLSRLGKSLERPDWFIMRKPWISLSMETIHIQRSY